MLIEKTMTRGDAVQEGGAPGGASQELPREAVSLSEMADVLREARCADDVASALEQARRKALCADSLMGQGAQPGAGAAVDGMRYEAVPVADPALDEARERELEAAFMEGLPQGDARLAAGVEYRHQREGLRIGRWRAAVLAEAEARRQRLRRDLEGVAARAVSARDDEAYEAAMVAFWARIEPMQPWLAPGVLETLRAEFEQAVALGRAAAGMPVAPESSQLLRRLAAAGFEPELRATIGHGAEALLAEGDPASLDAALGRVRDVARGFMLTGEQIAALEIDVRTAYRARTLAAEKISEQTKLQTLLGLAERIAKGDPGELPAPRDIDAAGFEPEVAQYLRQAVLVGLEDGAPVRLRAARDTLVYARSMVDAESGGRSRWRGPADLIAELRAKGLRADAGVEVLLAWLRHAAQLPGGPGSNYAPDERLALRHFARGLESRVSQEGQAVPQQQAAPGAGGK